MKRVKVLQWTGIVMATLVWTACDDTPTEPEQGIYTYEFAIRGRSEAFNFRAQTSVASVIEAVQAQLDLPADERGLFPNGPIASGDAGHNEPWDWHYVEDEWELAELAIEVCDGNPQLVQDDLDYWIGTVGRFCPWGAYVVRRVEP